jgi:hypothetical protein
LELFGFNDWKYTKIKKLLQSQGDNASFIWCIIFGQHQHISNQHTSSQHIATDDMTMSNELQNAISAVSVVQNSTWKPAKEFELGSLQKEFNLFETSGVRTPNLDMLLSALFTIQPTSTASERKFSVAGNFKTKIRSRMKFRVLNAFSFSFSKNIILPKVNLCGRILYY